jgi:hypothetical protein
MACVARFYGPGIHVRTEVLARQWASYLNG